jgi:hypothetical protein
MNIGTFKCTILARYILLLFHKERLLLPLLGIKKVRPHVLKSPLSEGYLLFGQLFMEPTQQFSILVSTLKTLNPKPLLKNPNFIVHPIVLFVDLQKVLGV